MPPYLPAIIALLALTAFYLPWLTGSWDFFVKDTTQFFEPLCRFIGGSLAHHQLPLWNPYSYCGMPQAAISSPSIFFPFNWLFAVLPFSRSLAVILLLSQLVCAAGTYLLVRALKWSRLSAATAGATAGFCGYMFSLSSNYTLVATAAWLPMVLFLSFQCMNCPRPLPFMLANSIAFALLISAGRPEISGPALLLIAGFLAAVRLSGNRFQAGGGGNSFAPTGSLLKSLFIGVLFAMPTILPSLEWLPWSRRSQGLPAGEILMFSANWFDLANLLLPCPLGQLQLRGNPFEPLVVPNNYVPYYGSLFAGGVVGALAVVGACKRGGLLLGCTLALFFGSVVLSFGENVPYMDKLVDFIPGASLLRFPSKLLFFALLAAAVLAARGMQLYLNERARLVPHLVLWGLLAACALALMVTPVVVLPFLKVPSPADAMLAQHLIALQAVAQCLLAFLALGCMQLLRSRKQLAGVIVVAAVFLSLLANAFVNCREPAGAGFFRQPSFVAAILNQKGAPANGGRVTALYGERLTVPGALESKDMLVATINDFQYNRQMLKPFTNIDFALPATFGFEGAMVGQYYYFYLNTLEGRQAQAQSAAFYRLLQLTASRYVITQVAKPAAQGMQAVPYLDSKQFRLLVDAPINNARVYELTAPLPRAYLAATWRSMPRDDVLQALSSPGFDPDPARVTLVESELGTEGQVLPQSGTFQAVPLSEPDSQTVIAEVDTRAPRLLVLQDQYYPGWHARVDGVDTPIVQANGFFRAVVVPAGRHKLVFSYEPPSVAAGLLLFLLGVAWYAGLLVWQRKASEIGQARL